MNWDGFLMGLGDFTQDRLKEERQKKMQEELLELKEKYAIEAEERQEVRTIAGETRRQGQYDKSQDQISINEDGTGTVRRFTAGGAPLDSYTLDPTDSRLIDRRNQDEDRKFVKDTKLRELSQGDRRIDLQGQEIAVRREANALAGRGAGETLDLSDDGAIRKIMDGVGLDVNRDGGAAGELEQAARQAWTYYGQQARKGATPNWSEMSNTVLRMIRRHPEQYPRLHNMGRRDFEE